MRTTMSVNGLVSIIGVGATLMAITGAGAVRAQSAPPAAPKTAPGTKPAPQTTPKAVDAKPAGSPPAPKPYSGIVPLSEDEILLSPGDAIQVQVENHPTLDGNFVIPGVGKLLLPEAGEITVAGLTVKQFRDKLQAELEKSLNNVYVRVLLKEVHSRHASIVGMVLHPGSVDMATSQYHLLDLIDMAGGLITPVNRAAPKMSDYVAALYRKKQMMPVDLEQAYKKPTGPQNTLIEPDDRLIIELPPTAIHEIHVIGQIPKQGAYPLLDSTTVLSIFGQCGYPVMTAGLSKSYVLRGAEEVPLNLRPILSGQSDPPVSTFKFQDGDILYIPQVKDTYMVWGQVGKQGNYPFPEAGGPKLMLLDAIQGAGESPQGEFRKVHLIRTINGKQVDKTINVDKMIKKGIMTFNEPIQANDIIFVPPKTKKWTPTMQDFMQPLYFLGYLGLRPF